MSVELNPSSTVENKSWFKISSAMSKCIRGPMLFHGEDDLNTSDLCHIVTISCSASLHAVKRM
jgi:hypothetical protein